MNIKKIIFAIAVLFISTLTVDAQQLAFPGAAGWGRFAVGGRNGSVYHVTNLNDSGTGSLRDAVSTANRIVVFDVAGVIKLNSILVFKNNLYVAGQTAPGEGITVYGGRVSFSGASNTIVRYMRFRLGHAAGQVDCAGAANGNNMIFDHCSFGWGGDETFSLNPDGKNGGLYNITLSNSIMGQGLMPHSAGGLIQTDSVTLYRNLYCDNSTRNNKIKGINQYANNIVYNWSNAAYNMGGDSEGESYCNIESNLFINGPAKGGAAFTGGNSNFHFYGDDNWQDSNMDGNFDPSLVTSYSAADRQSTPYNYPALELYNGDELITKNLPTVGASIPYRDYVDYYMVDEIMSYGKKGALISDESTLVYGVPTSWSVWGGEKRVDTDGDGMPDEWESANGTDPSKNDAMVKDANGYANIENYINSITIDDRQYFLRAPMVPEQESATTTTMTIKWRDWTYEEEGFIVEVQDAKGNWNEMARTAAGATSATISGLKAGTQYQVRLRAFAGEKYSDYTEVQKMSTRPEIVGIIDPDTYVPEQTLSQTGDLTWNSTDLIWNDNTAAFLDNRETLIAPTANTSLNLTESVIPQNLVVKSDADVTISGKGKICGDGSVNKAGAGTLTLNTTNMYAGATVLHDGTLEFSSIANGGVASAIGQSVEFAQNWIWDGGTYKYTGASATTNRSLELLALTTLNVANSATTLTFTNSVIEGADGGRSANVFDIDGNGTVVADTFLISKFDGALRLSGGTFKTTSEPQTSYYGAKLKKLIFNGGTFQTAGSTSGYETYSFPITLNAGTTSTFSPYRVCYINNTLSGSGNLIINIPYLREYINMKYSNFTGRIIAKGVSSESTGSLYLIQKGASSMTDGVLDLRGNARLTGWDTNASWSVGGIAGESGTSISGSSKQTNSFTTNWTVGSANTDETFNGKTDNYACNTKYSGTVNITKVGTGLWRLTNSSLAHKGTTKVNGGTLVMNGKLLSSKCTVASGATLKGTGTLSQAATISAGGTVEAGDTLVNGKGLTFASTLSIGNNSTVNIPLTQDKCNILTFNGNVTLGTGVALTFNTNEEALTRAPYADTEYKVFSIGSSASITGTFDTISTDVLEEGQSWDTTDLYTKGILRVVGGEQKPSGDDPVTPDVDPESETQFAMIAYGNCTLGSYDNSGVNNMLTGADNDEAKGFSLVCTGNLAKPLSSAGTPKVTNLYYKGELVSGGRTAIKMSNGAQESVFLPEGARATKVTFVGFSPAYTVSTAATAAAAGNGYPRTCYFKEVAGTTFTQAQAESEGKILQTWNDERSDPYYVSYDLNNVENAITFTNTGEQQAVVIIIEYHYGGTAGTGVITGIKDNVSSTSNNANLYDLQGRRINATSHGVYINNGKKFVK